MSGPLFSIIVPTFNVAATLRTCIGSIADQSYRDFELILVDGHSTDDTVHIAKSFTPELGSQLVIHSEPDRGVYDAMNRGVSLATGEWIIFLGADDVLHEANTLAKVAAFIHEHHHSDLVYGDVEMRSSASRYAGPFDLDRLLFEQNICHQAIFYRRSLFSGIGPFNLRYPVWADWDFNIRCFSNPALVTQYMDLVIANFNDETGLSRGKDKELKKRLPLYIYWSAIEVVKRSVGNAKRDVAKNLRACPPMQRRSR